MKIAFSTSGRDLNADLDSRFGRAPRFLIYDTDTAVIQVIDNHQNLNAAQGAGIQSAETVVRSGATVLITGHCGPKAFRVLRSAGVRIYTTTATTIADALEQFFEKTLQEAQSADVEAHWS